MRETWRWFGPGDEINLSEVRQTGAAGIVTALHHVPAGHLWKAEEIRARQAFIAQSGTNLSWDVVESLPVSEDIKLGKGDVELHLKIYAQSLENIASCGIKTVCYNFMPVIDWTRTALGMPLKNGGTAMAFDLVDFAVFDLCILGRNGAHEDYPEPLRNAAQARFEAGDEAVWKQLTKTIAAGLPGTTTHWTLGTISEALARYEGASAETMRENLKRFLAAVVPTAERLGLRLCCHPDDPPFPLLGLPRIMSTQEDFEYLVGAVDSPANGVTFCTGSLGVNPEFDPVAFISKLGHKIAFAHLRNTSRGPMSDGRRRDFMESEHLDGDTDMVATVRALLEEEARRREAGREDHEIPMRPDHGHALLSDRDRPVMPGYPLIGRMKGLAELRGVMAACAATP